MNEEEAQENVPPGSSAGVPDKDASPPELEAVLRWTPRAPLESTAAELAGRLLVSEAELGEALAHAEETGLLHTEGGRPLRLRLGPRGAS